MYSLPVRRLKEILSHVFPGETLGPVEQLTTTSLARLYSLTMSDDRRLVLSFPPSLSVHLLRHEASILSSEAKLSCLIAGSDPRVGGSNSKPEGPVSNHMALSTLIPKVLRHSNDNREMGYPYSIFEPTAGVPLSTVALYLSRSERRSIDKQVGLMARALASLTSPSGGFGPVDRVLPKPLLKVAPAPTALEYKDARVFPEVTKMPPIEASVEHTGSRTWSSAFHGLLEGVLRDGEDRAVLLPYEVIRAHYRRLSYHLDTVLIPRLLVLNIGNDRNIMVERGLDEEGSLKAPAEGVRVTGLRSWSQGVFGDPLLADCFDDPSEGCLEGWREGGEEIIEDETHAQVRILLYRCFMTAVGIVTEYYRPQSDSSRRELECRRNLTSALAELEKIGVLDDTPKRARSMSGDTELAKRQKVEN